jgi:hypothetical protein
MPASSTEAASLERDDSENFTKEETNQEKTASTQANEIAASQRRPCWVRTGQQKTKSR